MLYGYVVKCDIFVRFYKMYIYKYTTNIKYKNKHQNI